MTAAPVRIGLVSNGLDRWALATKDEAGEAVHYVRADLVDDLVAAEREACLAAMSKAEATLVAAWAMLHTGEAINPDAMKEKVDNFRRHVASIRSRT